MTSIDLSDLEKKLLRCLEQEHELADWWTEVKKSFDGIALEQFCETVKGLAEKELIVIGEGVPDPYFGLPEHFEADEREDIAQVGKLVNAFESDAFFDEL